MVSWPEYRANCIASLDPLAASITSLRISCVRDPMATLDQACRCSSEEEEEEEVSNRAVVPPRGVWYRVVEQRGVCEELLHVSHDAIEDGLVHAVHGRSIGDVPARAHCGHQAVQRVAPAPVTRPVDGVQRRVEALACLCLWTGIWLMLSHSVRWQWSLTLLTFQAANDAEASEKRAVRGQ